MQRDYINAFIPNAPFLYSQPYGFLMFSGDRKRVHWEKNGLKDGYCEKNYGECKSKTAIITYFPNFYLKKIA